MGIKHLNPQSFLLAGFLLFASIADAQVVGTLDSVSTTKFWGWALNTNASNQTVTVDIYSDGSIVASGVTDQLRADVNAAYKVTGNHGFSFAVPASLADGKNHSIAARVGSTMLWQSPISFNFGGVPPPPPPGGNPPVSASIVVPKTATWCDAQGVCATINLTVTQ